MIKNLSQLKRTLKAGTHFEITAHCCPEYIGQLREITVANTQGFYSIRPDEPDSKTSKCNGGRGCVLWWSKAPFWEFSNEICSIYSSDTKRTEDSLIMSFRVLGEEAA